MNIWIVKVGEPLPTDRPGVRLLRAGLLAEMLVKRGHRVTWWASTFDHQQKSFRCSSDESLIINSHYTIKLIHALGYKKNVSLRRFLNNVLVSRRFAKLACNEDKPDLILSALPTIELCYESVNFGRRNNIPVVLDLRDMWPDIILRVFPKCLRFAGYCLLYPLYKKMYSACMRATSLIGITDKFLDWGLVYAKRARSSTDKVYPLACPLLIRDNEINRSMAHFWKSLGLEHTCNKLVITYLGSLTRSLDFEPIIDFFCKNNLPVLLVIAGRGAMLQKYRDLAADNPNIIFPGWIDRAQISHLLNISSLGLVPLKNTEDFMMSIPNKIIEYLSAGLPILSGLKGVSEGLLVNADCGYIYDSQNIKSFKIILDNILKNKLPLQRMSENAIRLYDERFSAEKVYGDMAMYLECLVQKNSLCR